MIIDSSVLTAIVFGEPDADNFARRIESAGSAMVSAATILETSIVVGRLRQTGLDALIAAMAVAVVPFDEDQSAIARRAYVEYGKGSGSRARLNFGDCFSYALAKSTGQPLLFKGDDLTHTDVRPAYVP